jgi:uncharacterized protein (TIGR02646 family)
VIHVDLQPEPLHFDSQVRRPGLKFLARYPNPTQSQWRSHSYWTEVSDELHSRYGGICAYSCHWISYDTGWRQVEHFQPKSRRRQLAYEWSNYRLVCGVLNGRKGVEDILDPFLVQNSWFIIDFPSLLVKPAPNLQPDLFERVKRTCDILKLNDEATCMKSRARYVENYCRGRIVFEYLRQEAPFIALELQRQDLVEAIKDIMIYV